MSLKYVALMNYGCLEQGELQNYIWLVVYLPLWKIWVRQLGWLFLIWKNQIHVPNHQPVDIRAIHQSYSGWWCNNNLEKYESMGRMTSHIWNGKKKHVWNHQPVIWLSVSHGGSPSHGPGPARPNAADGPCGVPCFISMENPINRWVKVNYNRS